MSFSDTLDYYCIKYMYLFFSLALPVGFILSYVALEICDVM